MFRISSKLSEEHCLQDSFVVMLTWQSLDKRDSGQGVAICLVCSAERDFLVLWEAYKSRQRRRMQRLPPPQATRAQNDRVPVEERAGQS